MESSVEHTESLDEKIARIRKQNQEIIRRKQEIDEEIQSAKRNNAVVNVKKAYNDEPSHGPSLYSDSFVTDRQNTVTYPKMRVSQTRPNQRNQNKHEDVAWRREREEIDHERIRRQKAASGWRREWDADKTLEDQRKSAVEKNERDTTFRSRGSRLNENDNHDESTMLQQRRRPRVDANSNLSVKRDISQRLLPRKSHDNFSNGLEYTSTAANRLRDCRLKEPVVRHVDNLKKDVNSEVWNDSGPTEVSQGGNEIRKPLNRIEGNITELEDGPKKRFQTSGPLNLKKTIRNDNSNIVITKVTKYSETKVKTLPETSTPWNDYSNENRSVIDDMSESLKNIVIHVKNNDEKKGQRVVELVNEPSTKEEQQANTKSKTSNETPFRTEFSVMSDTSFSKDSSPTFNFGDSTQRPSKVFSFGDAGQHLEQAVSKTQEVVVDDDNDDEWEDVSDDEWEDVSD